MVDIDDGVPPSDVAAAMRMARLMFAAVVRSVTQADNRLTLPQMRVLVLVANSMTGETLSGVAAALDVHLSSAGRLCDRLVTAGWLDRHESPQDRRNLILSLTDDGSAVLASVMAHRREAFTRVLEQMTLRDRLAVRRGFTTFADAADEQPSILDHEAFLGGRGNQRDDA